MKKTVIALGSFIILGGALWSSAAWYTGKMIEDNIEQSIQQFTQNINKQLPNSHIKIYYSNYKRGVFSSTLDYKIERFYGEDEQGYSETLNEGEVTLSHGPFPLLRLKKLQLKPEMFVAQYNLSTLPFVLTLQTLTHNNKPIAAELSSNYSGDLDFNLSIIPFEEQDIYRSTQFSGLSLHLKTDAQLNYFIIDANVGQFKQTVFEKLLFDIKGFNLSISNAKHNNRNNIAIKDLVFNIDNKLVNIKNTLIKSNTMENKDYTQLYYRVDDVNIDQYPLGKGYIQLNLKNIPSIPFSTLWQFFLDPYLLKALFNQILIDGSELEIERLIWENSKGSLSLTSSMLFSGNTKLPISYLKNFHVDLSMSIPALTEIIAAYQTVVEQKKVTDNTKEVIKEQILARITSINQLFGQATKPFIGLERDNMQNYITYNSDENQVTVNGNRITIEDLMTLLKTLN